MNIMIVPNALNVQLSSHLQENGPLNIICIICISVPIAERLCGRTIMAKNKYGGVNDMPAGWTKSKTINEYIPFGLICCVVAMMRNNCNEQKAKLIRIALFVKDGFIYLTFMKIFKNYQDILNG